MCGVSVAAFAFCYASLATVVVVVLAGFGVPVASRGLAAHLGVEPSLPSLVLGELSGNEDGAPAIVPTPK